MAPQYEVYVSCSDRSYELASRFLDRFLPLREQGASEYLYPEFSEKPSDFFQNAEDVMRKLQYEPQGSYGLYWDRLGEGDPHQAMLFYTNDGGLIAGLASTANEPGKLLREAAATVAGRFGYMAHEERPPDSMVEFLERCRAAHGARLIEGELAT